MNSELWIRVGHAYAEYANDADYAHMRNMRMRMRIENLIHIIHIWIFAKNGNFLGQKWVSLALFSILSAQNIIIVHTSWFYPSSGMKIKSPKSQNFGQEKMIFFYYWCGLCALMRIWCASMRISKNRRMASPSKYVKYMANPFFGWNLKYINMSNTVSFLCEKLKYVNT